MPFMTPDERGFLGAVSRLAYSNPFLSQRIEAEREALGSEFRDGGPVWSLPVDEPDRPHANAVRIRERLELLIESLRERLPTARSVSERDLGLYQDGALYLLHRRHHASLRDAVVSALEQGRGPGRLRTYRAFRRDWDRLLVIPDVTLPVPLDAAHVFAALFQIHRAYHHVFRYIVGASRPAGRLRAAVWQSIFTHDMRRYRDTLYGRMSDVATLITGPSGTGKELVARAIGLSQYVPFNAETETFTRDFVGSFHALSLSALPATLIESELFGHRRGAFTGAIQDRRGWLETCGPGGTVFFDEIGDLDVTIQVKLLRVLQTRAFQAVGDTTDREFQGKIVAATNRDLAEAMYRGDFREDFYYRLCSDVIVTPSLHEQLREAPDVLRELVLFIAGRVAGADAAALASEVEAWIGQHLSNDYAWPGNIRELEQCVRSVMIRGEYRPPRRPTPPVREEIARGIDRGAYTAEDLLRRYCTLVHAQTGNYQETARRLELDRRTVKSRIDEELLERLREG